MGHDDKITSSSGSVSKAKAADPRKKIAIDKRQEKGKIAKKNDADNESPEEAMQPVEVIPSVAIPPLSLSRLGHHTQQTRPGAVHVQGLGRDLIRSDSDVDEAGEESFEPEDVQARQAQGLPELEASLVEEYSLAQAEPMPVNTESENKESLSGPRLRYCAIATALIVVLLFGASLGVVFGRSEKATDPKAEAIQEDKDTDFGGSGDGGSGDEPFEPETRPTGTELYHLSVKDNIKEESYHYLMWGVESACNFLPEVHLLCPNSHIRTLSRINATCERPDDEDTRNILCSGLAGGVILFSCGGEDQVDDRPAVVTMTVDTKNSCEETSVAESLNVAYMGVGRLCANPVGSEQEWTVGTIDSCDRGEEVFVSGNIDSPQNTAEDLLYCYEGICPGGCQSGDGSPTTLKATDDDVTCQSFYRRGNGFVDTAWDPLYDALTNGDDLVSNFLLN